MTDFDFDEIDKAVSGVLGSDEPVAVSTSSTVPPRPSDTSASSVAPAARRSSGRFMDMVHPTSDMRGRSSVSEPADRQPSSLASSSPSETPSSSQVFGSGQTDTSTDTPTDTSADTSTDTSAETLQAGLESIVANDSQSTSVTLETPFLPDAVVEKRPLGGSGFSDELTLEDLHPEQEHVETPEVLDTSEVPEAVESPMPEGFQSTPQEESLEAEPSPETPEQQPALQEVDPLNQLEPSEEPYIEESLPEPTAPDSEIDDAEKADYSQQQGVTKEEAPKEEVAAAPEVISSAPAGPASITQQYTEVPSSAKETGAIFDTESYHQAIPASGKKKSALWAIMWIVLLIVAGAGAGAAFYVYVLPML